MNRPWIIRVDASRKIGSGHVMRCFAIADFLKSGKIATIFFSRSPQVERQAVNKGFEVRMLPEAVTVADELSLVRFLMVEKGIGVVLLDIKNYHTFRDTTTYDAYFDALKGFSSFLVSFEDFENYPYPSDLVIIPYFGAEKVKLREKAKCKYLLGPKYFSLREEFMNVKSVTVRKVIECVLITMGGSDPNRMTLKVLDGLSDTKLNIHVVVVIGGLSQVTDKEIEDSLTSYRGTYSIVRDINNIAELMSESDMAIINSGLTKYEVSAVGLPSLVISNNDYHSKLMSDFARYKTVRHLGPASKLNRAQISDAITCLANDYELRCKMSERGKALIDGNGIARIFAEIPGEVLYA